MSVAARLTELGIELPAPVKPVAAYVPAVRWGNQVFVSGQIPMVNGEVQFKGKVGLALTAEEGYQAARLCAINALAALQGLIGDLDRVGQVIKVVGFVNSAPGFTGQPQVVNGASELFQAVFGEAGRHARSAVSCPELPLDSGVEVEVIFGLKD